MPRLVSMAPEACASVYNGGMAWDLEERNAYTKTHEPQTSMYLGETCLCFCGI